MENEYETHNKVRYRTHTCEITADRIAAHIERYYDKLSGYERDTLSHSRVILLEIADRSVKRSAV